MTKQSGALLNADSTFAVFFILTLPYVQNKGLLHRWNRGGGFFNQGTIPYVYKLFFGPGNRPPVPAVHKKKTAHHLIFRWQFNVTRGENQKIFVTFPYFRKSPC